MSLLNYSRFLNKDIKMNTINYDKYSTMSINQLISALNNAEKKTSQKSHGNSPRNSKRAKGKARA